MTRSASNTARFRPATDFPQGIQTLEREQANLLYEEMRDCLIFTNRSRGQLIRRNTEHKDKATDLKASVSQLQGLIDQLQTQKQSQLKEREALIAQLGSQVGEMSTQLNQLSEAFEDVGDIESEGQTHWGHLVFPQRIRKLLRAVRSLMQWWNQQDDSRQLPEAKETIGEATEVKEFTDQASVNRDLLDR